MAINYLPNISGGFSGPANPIDFNKYKSGPIEHNLERPGSSGQLNQNAPAPTDNLQNHRQYLDNLFGDRLRQEIKEGLVKNMLGFGGEGESGGTSLLGTPEGNIYAKYLPGLLGEGPGNVMHKGGGGQNLGDALYGLS